MNVDLKTMASQLKTIKQARIYFHKKPDGDAVGAAYGLAVGLQAAGAVCEVLCSDPVPATYRFMAERFRAGDFTGGLVGAIISTGDNLKEFFPYRSDDINEQSDEISFGK